MKKIFIFFVLLSASLSGFSQSVTILPTSTLGGGGSSNWITSGTTTATTGDVGVGLDPSEVINPLHVRSTNGISNGIMMEKRGNNASFIQLLKYGGTVASPAAVTTGILGQLDFMGSISGSGYAGSASIRARATETYSQFNFPSQLEFQTTPANQNAPLTRMVIDPNGRLGLNSGTTTPKGTVEVNYVGIGTATDPILNLIGGGNTTFPQTTHVRFGLSNTGNWAVNQEVIPGLTAAGATVNFRYYDNSNPSVASLLFGYTNNTFSVTGAMNATGSSSIGTNFAVGGTSGLTGKVTVGSSTATTAGVEIRSQTSTDANPDIYFKGTNNVLRFGNNVDGTSLVQTSLSNNTPNSASIAWKHISNANPAVSTPMMSLQGDGDLTVNGFTQLGADATTTTAGVTRSSPAMKTILLTGNIAAGATVYTTSVPHGLNAAKIVEVKVLVSGLSNFIVSDDFVDNRTTAQGAISGYQFATFTDATNVYILRHQTNGSNINNAGGLVSTYRILITYIP